VFTAPFLGLDQESVVFFRHGKEVNALFSWFGLVPINFTISRLR